MSVDAYWNSLFPPLKMMSATSQSHSTDSSYAFFIRPNLRFVNVTCAHTWPFPKSRLTASSLRIEMHTTALLRLSSESRKAQPALYATVVGRAKVCCGVVWVRYLAVALILDPLDGDLLAAHSTFWIQRGHVSRCVLCVQYEGVVLCSVVLQRRAVLCCAVLCFCSAVRCRNSGRPTRVVCAIKFSSSA